MWQSGRDGRLADVVYECIGAEKTLDQAIRISKPGGKLMVMGVFGKKPVVDMNTLQEAERVLYTSQAHVNEIATALEYMRDGKINADELITRGSDPGYTGRGWIRISDRTWTGKY